ncbi:MAG: phage shock protein PspA [bacterium ADurb.Bin425]|nr:MAG: phage shock protein PspA [bacterium ADurb.Bin425]
MFGYNDYCRMEPTYNSARMSKKPKNHRKAKAEQPASSTANNTVSQTSPNRETEKQPKQTAPNLLASKAMQLIDALEAELQQGHLPAWMAVGERLQSIFQVHAAEGNLVSDATSNEVQTHQTDIERTCSDLQSKVIALRQATAQAIATEMQLKRQVTENKELADTWQARAELAAKQKNPELAEAANKRCIQYVQASVEFEELLKQQKEATMTLRYLLTEFENLVQRADTKKQLLIARHKAAEATLRAIEIMAKFNTDEAESPLDRYEKIVTDLEAQIAPDFHDGLANAIPFPQQFLTDTVATLQLAIEAIQRLEQVVTKHPHITERTPNAEE